MKLTEDHIKQIELLVAKQGLFYVDIRNEVTDHFATTLEEDPELTPDNFEQKLHAYYNSHLWVKLLTAAQAQEKIRDNQYRRYFLHQFVSFKGIGLYILILLAVYAAELNIYIKRVVEVLFLISLLLLWIRPFRKKAPFMARLFETGGIYYLPVILSLQLKRFFDDETPVLMGIRLACMALIFTGHILLYKTNMHYKNQRYA
jgi:hypothetical protein